jgi:aspartyl-tRNA(Asn)/glutamyl-tRNA(Gln) amidotransferase subunit A
VRAQLETGLRYTAVDYAEARQTQVTERHRLAQIMAALDADNGVIVLTPTTPLTAPRFDDPAEMDAARPALSRFSAPWNMVGFPALSLPCGFTGAGLPIGLQLVGAAYHDEDVLAVGHAYQSATDWHRRRPAL